MYHFKLDSIPDRVSVSGLPVKIVNGENLTMTLVELPAGFANQAHRHPNEQLGYVLAGEVTYDVAGEIIVCRAGEVYLIPPDVPHAIRVSAEGPARLLEVFSPPRAEYK